MAEAIGRQCSAENEGGVADELELLQNIYLDELQVNSLESGVVDLYVRITPSTAGDLNKKHLYLDLHLALGKKYPQEPATTAIHTSRGLSDTRLQEISLCLADKAGELRGCPMVFELVECAKDALTEQNLPCGQCPVCLHIFQAGDDCTRTSCYHYFHVLCLARYVQFSEAEQRWLQEHPEDGGGEGERVLQCPVCREVLATGSLCLEAVAQVTPIPCVAKEDEEITSISPEVRLWQEKMAALLLQQQQRGGQIDEAAKDQVIDETWVRQSPHSMTTSTSTSPAGEEDRGIHGTSSRRKDNNTGRGGLKRRDGGHVQQSSRRRTRRREGDAQKYTSGDIQLTSRGRRRGGDNGDSQQTRRREDGDSQQTRRREDGDSQQTRRREDGDSKQTRRREDGDSQQTRRREDGDSQQTRRREDEQTRRREDGDSQQTRRREDGDSQQTRRREDGDSQQTRRREDGDSQQTRRREDGDSQQTRRREDGDSQQTRRREDGDSKKTRRREDGDSKQTRRREDGDSQQTRREDGDRDVQNSMMREDGCIQLTGREKRRIDDGNSQQTRRREDGDRDVQKSTRKDEGIQLTSREKRRVDDKDAQQARRREHGDAQLSRRKEDGDIHLTSRERRRKVCDGDAWQARRRDDRDAMKSSRDDGDTQLSGRERGMGAEDAKQVSRGENKEGKREDIRQVSSEGRRGTECKESHQNTKESSKCGNLKNRNNQHSRSRMLELNQK